jgi:hypothetical protein
MVAGPRLILVLVRLRVLLPPRHGHGTPALRVGTLLAGAASPAPAHSLELAVLERAVAVRGLRRGVADVLAGLLIPGLEVDHGRRAVVPCDRGVGAGMVARMSMAHSRQQPGGSDRQELVRARLKTNFWR